jgi:hypothetical protein
VILDAIMTKMDVRRADRVDRRDWMVGDQSPRGLDFLGNLITERLDPGSWTWRVMGYGLVLTLS